MSYRGNSSNPLPAALVLLAIICGGVFIVWAIGRFYNDYQFDVGCGGRLKRAADANTIELAEKELSVALKYCERHGYTEGNTGIIFITPDKDVGFWYANLNEAHKELLAVPPETSKLERTNVLMKLRETLLDHGQSGDHVTIPAGISIYPHNGQWALTGWLSIIFCIIFAIGAFATTD